MKSLATFASLVLLLAVTTVIAQEPPKPTPPQKEHEWLQQFVGEWETESEASMGPGQPAMKCKGTISARSLGGFWVVSELKSDMMGTPMTAIQTVGYDPQTKKYVGSWVDSIFNYMWKYQGTVDETGKILTLEAEGPNFMAAGKMTKFRDVYEFKTPDHVVLSYGMQGEDGKWITFMTGNSRKKKK